MEIAAFMFSTSYRSHIIAQFGYDVNLQRRCCPCLIGLDGMEGNSIPLPVSIASLEYSYYLSQSQPADSHAAHGSFHDLLSNVLRHDVVIRFLFQPLHVHRNGFNGQRLILHRFGKLRANNRLRSLHRADGVQRLQQIFE